MMPTDIKNRFENLIIFMLTSTTLSPYANILARCNIYETEELDTMGIRINHKNLELYYNKEYLKSLSNNQLIFILIHEMYHIMFHHPQRETSATNHDIANLVEDAIINDSIIDDYNLMQCCEKPVDKNNNFTGITTEALENELNIRYNGIKIFEDMYMWYKHNQKSQQQPSQNFKPGNSNGTLPIIGQFGFDTHIQHQCTEIEAQMIKEELMNEVKSRGNLPAGLEKALKIEFEKQPDYLKIIKKVISNHLLHGIKKKTFSRPHIYGIEGLKGNIYRQFQINCILDTSGSMSDEVNFVLGFLYKNKVIVRLIQCDAEIQNIELIKNTKKIIDTKIKGFGGTILQPAIDNIAQDKNAKKYCNLILTDGYTDTLDFRNINRPTLIISTEVKCPIKNDNNRVKQIIIKH